MKILLDENISQTVAQGLRDAGFTIFHVLDVGLGNADDHEIMAFARKRKLTIVTHDKDFGNLIRFPVSSHYGVVLLRFRNQSPQSVLPRLLGFLKDHHSLKSRLVILREDGFRVVSL